MASSPTAAKTHAIENEEADPKQDLERRIEESRDSITHTVQDIKDAVADEYESIKRGISETFDWHEQFRKHPIAWMFGSLAVGYVLGNSLASAYSGTKRDDQLLSYLSALGERFTDELSRKGMSILAPALTGTILVPVLTSKLDEVLGIDLSDLPKQLFAEFDTQRQKNGGKKKNKKGKKKIKNRTKSNPKKTGK